VDTRIADSLRKGCAKFEVSHRRGRAQPSRLRPCCRRGAVLELGGADAVISSLDTGHGIGFTNEPVIASTVSMARADRVAAHPACLNRVEYHDPPTKGPS
jgi:hypothetical protein